MKQTATGQTGQVQATPGQTPRVQSGQGGSAPGSAGQNQKGQAGAPGAQVAFVPQPERALVPASAADGNLENERNATGFGARVARLPVEVDVSIPLRDFRVRNLLTLEKGRLIESEWSNGVDLPLAAGAVQLAWSEFEVIETQLVVRLTRLA